MNAKENGTLPAMASSLAATPDGTIYSSFDKALQDCGLSKREYIAIAVLQGLVTNPEQLETDVDNQTSLAIEYADALLEHAREMEPLRQATANPTPTGP